MKLRLVVVGRDRQDPLCLAAGEYLTRIERYYPIQLVEVREEPARASTPLDRVRQVEAERIRKALPDDAYWIVLDERGKELGSVDLAKRLGTWAGEGRSEIAFVIGGPGGLDPALAQAARERWSLSKLTLPHRLARLLLAEQLYRACTILRGEPYHK